MSAALAGDAIALASAGFFALSNVLIARGARPGSEDNGAFVSLLLTAGIASLAWIAVGAMRGFEPVTGRALLWFAGAGIFTAYIGRVFFYETVERLGAMRSSAMKRLQPFFAVLLGVLVLGEHLTTGMGIGMLFIVASFLVLVGRSASRTPASPGRKALNAGYIYGPLSALGYATGYVLRKMGLADAHDALLGAAVGALVAAAVFVATAGVSAQYARAVRATFAQPNAWLIGAGVMSSIGQILYFAALNVSPMSRVALITSIEVFITIFLGVLMLRRRESLTPAIAIAAALGVAGTAFIIAA